MSDSLQPELKVLPLREHTQLFIRPTSEEDEAAMCTLSAHAWVPGPLNPVPAACHWLGGVGRSLRSVPHQGEAGGREERVASHRNLPARWGTVYKHFRIPCPLHTRCRRLRKRPLSWGCADPWVSRHFAGAAGGSLFV